MKKSKIYNVIILDKSGSMSSCSKLAVDSVNETLGAIRSSAKKNESVEYYVTLVAFCGCERNVIIDNRPIASVENISYDVYSPCCTTPLYDAIGFTVTRIHEMMRSDENSTASVTIITDGYENASKEYSRTAIKALIDSYKSEGWMFAYIGADHDVESVAFSLSIDNTMKFDKSRTGFGKMSSKLSSSLECWSDACCLVMSEPSPNVEEKKTRLRKISEKFFE